MAELNGQGAGAPLGVAGGPTRAAVILPWERQGREVPGADQPRAAEARMAEAVGLAGSIGLAVVHEAIAGANS